MLAHNQMPTKAPPSAVVTLYDQLKLLLNNLANQYELVTVQTLMDAEVPVFTGTSPAGPTGFDVRYTDQNAVLVRTDLRRQLALANIQQYLFKIKACSKRQQETLRF
jgi:hypothetical protein